MSLDSFYQNYPASIIIVKFEITAAFTEVKQHFSHQNLM